MQALEKQIKLIRNSKAAILTDNPENNALVEHKKNKTRYSIERKRKSTEKKSSPVKRRK